MAGSGELIPATTFNNIKTSIQSEIQSRSYTGSISAQYNANTYTDNPASEGFIKIEHYNKILADCRNINSSSVPSDKASGDFITASEISALETRVSAHAAYDITSTTATDCASSCTGGCYNGCYTGCTGCNTTCTGGCTGNCVSGCSNGCTSCSGCAGSK